MIKIKIKIMIKSLMIKSLVGMRIGKEREEVRWNIGVLERGKKRESIMSNLKFQTSKVKRQSAEADQINYKVQTSNRGLRL